MHKITKKNDVQQREVMSCHSCFRHDSKSKAFAEQRENLRTLKYHTSPLCRLSAPSQWLPASLLPTSHIYCIPC